MLSDGRSGRSANFPWPFSALTNVSIKASILIIVGYSCCLSVAGGVYVPYEGLIFYNEAYASQTWTTHDASELT